LEADDDFSRIHVNTFLQGSYKRQTMVKPGKDVDIVVVTSLDPDKTTSTGATLRLKKCLERFYDKVDSQNRALCVTLSYVTMDVVVAASRQLLQENGFSSIQLTGSIELADRWKAQPLQIPDRELKRWVDTHPKQQLEWTTALNKASGGYFVSLVKMFKWWRKRAYTTPEHPKGYALERIVGEVFDQAARDHAEGFVNVLRGVVTRLGPYAQAGLVPFLGDPGVPTHNVLRRLSVDDFMVFIDQARGALTIAEAALASRDKAKSVELWQRLFGAAFPSTSTASQATAAAAFPNIPVRPPNRPAGFA
jgi:hypothetical protein